MQEINEMSILPISTARVPFRIKLGTIFFRHSVWVTKAHINSHRAILGNDQPRHRLGALIFCNCIPSGHPRGPLGIVLTKYKYKHSILGRDFFAWTEYVLGIIPIRHMVPLPASLVSFQDHEWLQPQVRGLTPPERPRIRENVIRWRTAAALSGRFKVPSSKESKDAVEHLLKEFDRDHN